MNLLPTVEPKNGMVQASKPLPDGSELVGRSRLEGAVLDITVILPSG